MKTVAVVGATGYLGTYVSKSLQERGYQVRYLVRNKQKLVSAGVLPESIRQVDVTKPSTLSNHLDGVDSVISCLGITRQKDGVSYMDIDYQANVNILDEAIKGKVKKFIYVSVFKGNVFRHVALCDAKERFVDYLKQSNIPYCIVRPTGFFSDMKDFWDMANSGRVYLFGDGSKRLNPIHGKDLSEAIVDQIDEDITELDIGGPDVFSHTEIASLAFESQAKKNKITYLPDVVRKIILWVGNRILPQSVFGPAEFFLTLLATDMVAPSYGEKTLQIHFENVTSEETSNVNNLTEAQS